MTDQNFIKHILGAIEELNLIREVLKKMVL